MYLIIRVTSSLHIITSVLTAQSGCLLPGWTRINAVPETTNLTG